MNIQDSVHRMLLGQFGWSEDEYEDGEKAESNDVDLDEENTILADPDGFKVIWVEKDKYPSKQHENVFSRVCSKFYQTMAKAQRNFQVTKVGIIVNTKLKARYDQKKAKLMEEGNDKEEWGFHGTSEDTIMKIAQTGFLHPDQIAKINAAATSKKSSKKKSKQPPPIAVLDDGYFGAGIYFSCYSDYAMWYSEEKDSEQVLLTKLLPGKAYKCTKRMDGSKCMSGYDSHFSPKGNEIIMFDPKACLPRYIIAYKSQEEEEREQES